MAKAKRRTKPATKAKAAVSVLPFDSAPPPPASLGKFGRACWVRLAAVLVESRKFNALHLESFETLCDWWDVYQTNKLALIANPDAAYFTTESGYQQRSPVAVARNEAFTNFLKLSEQFGLTPEATRKVNSGANGGSRVSRGNTEADDPAATIKMFAARKYGDN